MLDASSPRDRDRLKQLPRQTPPSGLYMLGGKYQVVKALRPAPRPSGARQPGYCPRIRGHGTMHALEDQPSVSQDMEPCRGTCRCPAVLGSIRSESLIPKLRRGVCMCRSANTHRDWGALQLGRTWCCFSPLPLLPHLAQVCFCGGLSPVLGLFRKHHDIGVNLL